jgi:adenylate cyclase
MERKLAAIFSADVAGYSRLMGEDEEATIRTLTAYREVMGTLIQQHHGRVVDSPGDNLLAEFASVVDAVRCAVEIQQTLRAKNAELPDHRKMEFRIGINLGDVVVEGERLYGDGVNIAARLESLAEPGGICLSGTVYDHVENKLPLTYEYLGEQSVKNITKPVRVYRVVLEPEAAVSPGDARSPQSTVHSPQSKKGGQKPRKVGMNVSVLVFVVLVAGILAVRYFPFSTPSTQHPTPDTQSSVSSPQSLTPNPQPLPLPDKPSVAVLPFTNMSNDPEQEYFSDGITDTLITDLSKLSELFVIARHSTFFYKGKPVPVTEVSRELGVRYVVEGSVQKAGNQVRINIQLIDATTGGHVWAERYDRDLKGIFALQDEVTRQIVRALQVKLTKGEQAQLWRKNTDNVEAYDSLLRGVAYYLRYTKETNAQARQMFERAIALDLQYADAYALLGWTYWIEWVFQWSPNPAQALDRFAELAHQALALDSSLPAPHAALGYAYLWKDRRYNLAIAELQKAVALAPSGADEHWGLAEGLNLAARHAEALEVIQQAMQLNPHYPAPYAFNLAWAYDKTGQVEAAIAAYKQAINLNPDFLAAHLQLAALYSKLGQEEAARAEAAEVLRVSPQFSMEKFVQNNPYADRAALERFVENLRRAGLK